MLVKLFLIVWARLAGPFLQLWNSSFWKKSQGRSALTCSEAFVESGCDIIHLAHRFASQFSWSSQQMVTSCMNKWDKHAELMWTTLHLYRPLWKPVLTDNIKPSHLKLCTSFTLWLSLHSGMLIFTVLKLIASLIFHFLYCNSWKQWDWRPRSGEENTRGNFDWKRYDTTSFSLRNSLCPSFCWHLLLEEVLLCIVKHFLVWGN